ncbi:unnamed protein product [Calicophoron daubneyi]|uniref:Reticulon-like protein n=1 Tax=Calicophoron daubneyi TaxID=300641 RepID=A0AAV2TTM4_CALDB
MDALRDLIEWREPVKSGIFTIVVMTGLISLSCLSLVSVISYAGLSLLCCTGGARLYHYLLTLKGENSDAAQTDVFSDLLAKDVQIPREKVASQISSAAPGVSKLLNSLRDALLCANYVSTVKLSCMCYLLLAIGNNVNLLTLVTVAFILTMTCPKVYILYQPHFDAAYKNVQEFSGKIYKKVEPTVNKFLHREQKTK